MNLLEVKNLKMYYETLRGYVKAVDDVSFYVKRGEALGLAGESGCGKTSAALSIMRLLPSNAKIMGGSIFFNGEDTIKIQLKKFRGEFCWKKISVIFQGAMNCLFPIKKIGDQITEPMLIHENIGKKEAWERARRLLDLVGVGAERIDRYPHELSGGLKQRVMIAMSLACNPELVIADEPTTALDVIMQSQILNVIDELREKLNLSMILISHNLSVIADSCDTIAIMYAGKIVEYADVTSLFKKPLHPYSEKLINAFPSIVGERRVLSSIGGSPPDLLSPPPGCRFHPRCPYVTQECKEKEPELIEASSQHWVACHLVG
jgi:peptide/nickel transport system ATP-binding protein